MSHSPNDGEFSSPKGETEGAGKNRPKSHVPGGEALWLESLFSSRPDFPSRSFSARS